MKARKNGPIEKVLLSLYYKPVLFFVQEISVTTVVPTKSDNDIIFCLQLFSKTLTCTPHSS